MRFLRNTSGFTLVELMIVISMVMILFGISLFPYDFYMDRARVENSMDIVRQEWILTHNDIKNGLLYDDSSHAHGYIVLEKGKRSMDVYISTGSTNPKKLYRSVPFEGSVEILDFTGITLGPTNSVVYHISPPYATGSYSTGTIEYNLTGVTMILGYTGASLESRRARQVLLRPYYD